MKNQIFLKRIGIFVLLLTSLSQLKGADDPYGNIVSQVSGYANAAQVSSQNAARSEGVAQESNRLAGIARGEAQTARQETNMILGEVRTQRQQVATDLGIMQGIQQNINQGVQAVHLDRNAIGQALIQTANDRAATLADRNQTQQDRAATGLDRAAVAQLHQQTQDLHGQVQGLSNFMQDNFVHQQEELQDRERGFNDARQQALIAAENLRQNQKIAAEKQRQQEMIIAEEVRQQERLAAEGERQKAEHKHQNEWWDKFYENSGVALKATGEFVSEPKKMGKTALGIGGIALGIYTARHGTAVAKTVLEKYLMTPSLVKDTNVPTLFKEVLYTIIGKKELPEVDFDQLILSPEIKERVMNVARSAQKITHNKKMFKNANYQNVCFYGPPGTGKTMAAKMLAGYADMSYAYINGGDVAKLSKADAILQLQALFQWAEKSDKGLLLFVDEAESFLCNREGASEDLKQMVNAFIAECGTSSKKFMIVTATNHVSSLDTAVRSRIEHFIPFEYPGSVERHAIIDLYLKKFSRGKKGKAVVKIESGINYESIVEKTKDFSGRDLEKMVNDLVLQAQMNHESVISNSLFQKVASIWKEQIPVKRKMGINN